MKTAKNCRLYCHLRQGGNIRFSSTAACKSNYVHSPLRVACFSEFFVRSSRFLSFSLLLTFAHGTRRKTSTTFRKTAVTEIFLHVNSLRFTSHLLSSKQPLFVPEPKRNFCLCSRNHRLMNSLNCANQIDDKTAGDFRKPA